MEYRMSLTVSETVHEGSMAARVFITQRDEDNRSETAQIWECSVPKPEIQGSTDPISWVADLMALVDNEIQTAYMATMIEGQRSSIEELFMPKLFLRVAAGAAIPRRP